MRIGHSGRGSLVGRWVLSEMVRSYSALSWVNFVSFPNDVDVVSGKLMNARNCSVPRRDPT